MFRSKNIIFTSGIYLILFFRDNLLWGFQNNSTKFIDNIVKSIRKTSRVEWCSEIDEDDGATVKQNLSKKRLAFLNDFTERFKKAEGKLPLLTLSEFFADNTEEESIAPNQWEAGRPTLSVMWKGFQKLENRADVAWVRVQLHADTEIDGDECVICGNAIAVCTTADISEIEQAVDTKRLCSDGVIKGWVYPLDMFTDIPNIQDNHHVVSIVWD